MLEPHQKHRILREVIRNYTTFQELCRQQPMEAGQRTGDWSIEHKGLTINFLDLQSCLKKLSPRKKQAVFYNVIMDEKQKDVAARMGITTVSVGQYVEQAMLQVAKDLWPEEAT
jgi:DNA-directed RNA polymerase specialized sigma24 family protein